MESKWRQNVANFGLTYEGMGLIARLVDTPTIAVSNNTTFSPLICRTWIENVSERFWSSWFLVAKPDPFVRFPYGFAVEPDELP